MEAVSLTELIVKDSKNVLLIRMSDVLICNVIKMLLNVLKLKDVPQEDYYVKMDLVLIHSKIALNYLVHYIYQLDVMMGSVLMMLNSVIMIMDAHSINNTNAQMVNVFLIQILALKPNVPKIVLFYVLTDLANLIKTNASIFKDAPLKLLKNVVMENVLTPKLLNVALLFVLKNPQLNVSMVFVLKLTLDVLQQLTKI